MSTSLQIFKGSDIEDLFIDTTEYAGELTIEVAPEHIVAICKTLKEQFGFNYLSDITAIDYYTDEKRFGLAYNLMNINEGKRLRIKCKVEEESPEVDTVTSVWKAADWFERECFDMMGIKFTGHPDMRRIFLPEDFEYYPLRKEFPLIGIPGTIEMPEKVPPKEYK